MIDLIFKYAEGLILNFNKPNLVLVAPNDDISYVANSVIKESRFNCRVVVGNLEQGVELARIAEDTGAEVIISRGGTYLAIQSILKKVPIVQINVTTFDLLEALYNLSYQKGKIGVVGYHNTIYEASLLGKYLNLDIVEIPVEEPLHLEKKLLAEMKKGMKFIIGDTISIQIGRKLGLQGGLISSGKRTIYEALDRAEEIALLRRKDNFTKDRFSAIIDSVGEGIIATDSLKKISHCNQSAINYLNIKSEKLVGKSIEDIIPNFPDNDDVISCGSQQYLVSSEHIGFEGCQEAGFVISIKPIKQIQDTERRLREKLLRHGHIAKNNFTNIVGDSEKIQSIIKKAKKISKSDATVLITGETGVGKEIFAQSIHNESRRANAPFVAVNCASLPESILESELFGYVEGSFTDALKGGKMGLFELAHRGTIFLDELGDMSVAVQAKVLRVIQEKEVVRLGDNKIIPINIRIIAASNFDLWEAVMKGRFREDLYYRVNVLPLHIPPIKERGKDIVLIAEHLLKRLSPSSKLEDNAFIPLLSYHWPGNVRELYNFIQQLVVLHDSEIIRYEDVKHLLSGFKTGYIEKWGNYVQTYSKNNLTNKDIIRALKEAGGNKSKAAESLGINRTTLWRKLKEISNID